MTKLDDSNRNFSLQSDLESLAGPVPDKVYFIKLFKRHVKFIVTGTILAFLIALAASIFVPNTYVSSIHVIFDQTDMASSGIGGNPQMGYNTVARLFRARFRSQEFLANLLENAGGREVLFPPDRLKFLGDGISKSKKLIKSTLLGKKTESNDPNTSPNAHNVRDLMKMLDAYPEPESGILTLTVYAHSPEISNDLATKAMDLFITRELEDQIKSLDLKLEFLKADGDSGVLKSEAPSEQAGKKREKSVDEQPNQLDMLKTKEKESEILEKIRLASDEVARIRGEKNLASNTLGAEIARLLTNLQPDHPLLISKKRELDSKLAVLNGAGLTAQRELEQWRQALWSIRATGIMPQEDNSFSNNPKPGYQGAFYVALNDRLKDLDLERKNLYWQLSDPNLRTRLRILFPASFDTTPFSNKKRDLFIAICSLGIVFIFGFSLVQEIRCPLARDDWRIQRASGHSIITQISKQSLAGNEVISAKETDKLRERLRSKEPRDLRTKAFLSYRRWELAIEQHCKGPIVLLIASGSTDKIGFVINNFFNIFTTDTGKKCLLIDFDHKDPVVSEQVPQTLDFADAMLGKAKPSEIIVKGLKLGLGFDYVPPSAQIEGERTRIFRKKDIEEFLKTLAKDYDMVFVRGLPEYHFIENTCLMDAANDCILSVDASRTKFAELRRTAMHMDSEKVRGLVVIGS